MDLIHIGNVNQAEALTRSNNVFGVTSTVRAALWHHLMGNIENDIPPVHLLWVLIFLLGYETEYFTEVFTGASRNTHKEHCCKMFPAHAELQLVSETCKTTSFRVTSILMTFLHSNGVDIFQRPFLRGL